LSFLGYKVLIIDVDDNAAIHKILSKREDIIKTELFITDLLLDNQLSPIPFIQEHRGHTSSRKYPKPEIKIDFIPADRTENETFDQRLVAKRLDFKKEIIFRDLIAKIQAETLKPFFKDIRNSS